MTTTDPFTTARDDAAQFLWALPDDHPAKPLHNDGFMQTHARVVASLMAEWARSYLAAQEESDAVLDALYDAFVAHSEEERSEEFTHTEDGEPYTERICSECGEAVWIKGEHYWAATRANGARKRHHVARAALSAARRARGGTK